MIVDLPNRNEQDERRQREVADLLDEEGSKISDTKFCLHQCSCEKGQIPDLLILTSASLSDSEVCVDDFSLQLKKKRICKVLFT